MRRAIVSLLVAACLLCTATALVETRDSASGAVFVSQHVKAPSFIEAPSGPGHNTHNGLFHPGGRRVDHNAGSDDDDDEEQEPQEKVSHDPSANGDEGDDDENAEESGEEGVEEDRGSDAEDFNAERRAERLADHYGGIPEDYLGKDIDKIIQSRRDARQQALIDAPKRHLSLFAPRGQDEESDEEAPAPAPALASNAHAPHGGRAGLGPRMQEVNSPSGFPETPAAAGNFVPGAGAMSMDGGIDPSYDVTSPADQAMFAFEQQQKLMQGMPTIPMEGGGFVQENIPLPRFGGVQEPQMPSFGGAPQMAQEPMMDRPKPEVKFVDPRFASVRAPAPQIPMARGFAQRGPADQEEMEQEAPQRPVADEFRFRSASGVRATKASKATASKWDHSQSHITQRFLTNIGYARQQRALQRRRENGRDRHDAAAPEAEPKQEEEQQTQMQNLGAPPPPDFRAPSLMEEEARVHTHTSQGHTHRVAQRVSADSESEAVPPRRTRYERLFARPAPRARRGSLLEVDAASEAMDSSAESQEIQGKPAGLPDMPEFEAPPPDPSAAQASTPTGPAGLREEVYSPPHVVV